MAATGKPVKLDTDQEIPGKYVTETPTQVLTLWTVISEDQIHFQQITTYQLQVQT